MAELTYPKRIIVPGLATRSCLPGLQLVSAGCMPEKTYRHNEPFGIWAMGLVIGGSGDYRKGSDVAQAIGPGCVFTVHPGGRFDYGPAAGSSWAECFFAFRGEYVQQWVGRGWFWTDGSVRRVADWRPIASWWMEMLDALERAGAGDVDRAVLLCERIMLEVQLATNPVQRVAARPVDPILQYCRTHYARDIDFHRLADEMAMSYSNLRQSIRRATGYAPAHYLARLRCDAAATLLRDSDLPIKAIARKVGISDPYTFSKLFRRTVGLAPLQFRRQAVSR